MQVYVSESQEETSSMDLQVYVRQQVCIHGLSQNLYD